MLVVSRRNSFGRPIRLCAQVITYWCDPNTGELYTAPNSCAAEEYEKKGYVKVFSDYECMKIAGIAERKKPEWEQNIESPCKERTTLWCDVNTGQVLVSTDTCQERTLQKKGYIQVNDHNECERLYAEHLEQQQQQIEYTNIMEEIFLPEEQIEKISLSDYMPLEQFYNEVSTPVYEDSKNQSEACPAQTSYMCNPNTGEFTVSTDACMYEVLLNQGFIPVSSYGECESLVSGSEVNTGRISMLIPVAGAAILMLLLLLRR